MKKKNLLLSLTFLASLLIVFSACKKDEEQDLPYKNNTLQLPAQLANYEEVDFPMGFEFEGITELPGVTDEVATIGRVLFYDTKLSVNNKVSCGSCHKQEFAFSDPVAGSLGFDGRVTPRNAQAIINCFNKKSFFWDSRIRDLGEMVLKPVGNHIEMGMEQIDELEVKLSSVDYYKPLFTAAYGTPEITKEKIADGLTQFLLAMVSVDSKHDQAGGEFNIDFSKMTPAEVSGAEVFWGKGSCADCHGGKNLRGWGEEDVANIGLDVDYLDEGMGDGRFQVPSLRNVSLTAPYMHDGRFASLREVINHYNEGIQDHPNLDFRLRGSDGWDPTGEPRRLNLNEEEIDNLIAFIHTFTDESFITDEKFSDPFVR